jgi:fido (protein-threonine AMPylation protein)
MAIENGSETPDPFLIRGTNTLRNRFNERDPEKLSRIERLLSGERAAQRLMGVAISPAGLCGLHRYLFQDVYPWAGQTRQSMTLSKGDAFLHGRFVDAALAKQFERLKQERNLKGLTAENFAERAAFHIGEINFIHPFREGNAARCGYSSGSSLNRRDTRSISVASTGAPGCRLASSARVCRTTGQWLPSSGW